MIKAVSKDLARYLENWQSEIDSAAQYHALAKAEASPQISKVYENLAAQEEKHISFWEKYITDSGNLVPKRTPTFRSRIIIWLTKKFGPQVVLSTISQLERADQNGYLRQSESSRTKMTAQEQWHTLVLGEIEKTSGTGVKGSALAKIEGRHRSVGGNALRAAVLGANDGLCSNMSLVMGAAGAAMNNHALLLTGLAGLFAGSCSMALGEWISVTSARELAEREIRIETAEFDHDTGGESEELQLIYESKGISAEESKKLVDHMLADKTKAIDSLTREELGINPDDLGGSALEAATYSFLLFAVGAILPVFPFFFLNGSTAVIVSLACSAAALFIFGFFTTIFTGQSLWIAGPRQVGLGLLSAVLTFGLGHLLGVSLK
jgi:VIT1/CCC1 family predicted Fe2+/Mn2+ transporter